MANNEWIQGFKDVAGVDDAMANNVWHWMLTAKEVKLEDKNNKLKGMDAGKIFKRNGGYGFRNSFQNGRLKAEKYLNDKAMVIGVKLENDKIPTTVGWYVTDFDGHIKAGPMSEAEAKKKRDANPDKLDASYFSDYDIKRIQERD